MSYADRVDRLKKVIGIEQIQVNNKLPLEKRLIGPPPRAEKRFQYDEKGILLDEMPMQMPGPEFKDLAESSMRFRKFFDEMQKMMQLLPGMDGSGSGQGFMQFGFPTMPNGNGQDGQSPSMPSLPFLMHPQSNPNSNSAENLTKPKLKDESQSQPSIPPYIDPNSI